MIALTIAVTFCFALFSTGIMSYISLATPIGPWVAPMLTLIAIPIFSAFIKSLPARNRAIMFSVAGGSVGGILAVACGSSYPTLFFLDAPLFLTWMHKPIYFVWLLTIVSLAAGLYGFFIAELFETQFIDEQKLSFPIGQLVASMITAAQGQARKVIELVSGFVGTFVFCALQGGLANMRGFIPSNLTLIRSFSVGLAKIPAIQLRLDSFPMLWAIGFLTGSSIAIPLAVGALSKIVIVDPMNNCLFGHICSWDFSIAFCSGLVASSSLLGFSSIPALITQYRSGNKPKNSLQSMLIHARKHFSLPFAITLCIALIAFFYTFHFSILQAAYLLIGTFLSTYVMTSIAGKIGLAQLGRFATFIMVPALFIFGIHPVHLTLIATFVEISGGVATDILFGRKMARLGNIPKETIRHWQLFGLVISSCAVGLIFWALINHFGLGSEVLFAQRAQARALLISMQSFNVYVLFLGALYGLGLKKLNLNPMLVFGGLLMPLNYSLGLIIGGLSTYATKHPKEWEPFCSGVFAANSLYELLKVIW